MVIIITKIPQRVVLYNYRHRFNRINYTIRQYANHPTIRKKVNTGTAYTIGLITLASVGTIGFAKYDPQFRQWMGENVPYSEEFFKFIFQEEKPFSVAIADFFEKLGNSLGGSSKRRMKPLDEKEIDYTPPHPVFPSLVNKEEKKEEKFNEIRVQNLSDINIVKEKPKPQAVSNSPKTIADLELKINESATKAIKTFNSAEIALKDYNRDVEVIIEDSVDKLSPAIWNSLKEKTEKKNRTLKEAEETTKKCNEDLQKLRCLLDDPDFDAPETAKGTVRRNIERLLLDICVAQENYEKVLKASEITEKYWKKVEAARCRFIDELEILFPDFDINNQKLTMKPSDLDLFLVYVYAHLMFHVKELRKMETVSQMRLNQALDAARKREPDNEILADEVIRSAIEKEKRKLTAEFDKKCLELRKERERELRHRLKCQEQAHLDHLHDALLTREMELERQYNNRFEEQLADEQSKYKLQMAGMIARMKGMRNAILERLESDKIARQSQVLWSACQALHHAVKGNVPGVCWYDQIRPLKGEIEAIKQASVDGDDLVNTVLTALPPEASERGVFPEGALRERFLKVEKVARRLALIPAEGARLPLYFLSYLQSLFLVNAVNPIPQCELQDCVVDFSKLNTYDILQRARYWLDRGNFTQTLKYMNLLKGASRCVANDWIREARILLETQQAAETLMAHAIANGLQHV